MVNQYSLPNKLIFLLFLAINVFAASSCSKKLLRRSDYAPALKELQAGRAEDALKLFPVREDKTFITIMEKTYLNLIQGKAEIDDLRKYAHKIESRLKYQVSRELKFLVYVETPEGYYASEHEIIWMHILLAWGYGLRENFDGAAVEAKKAALLLEGKSREGRFDDPMIRIILGSIWSMCGRWEDARVDFRVAASQDSRLRWAQNLSEMETPPAFLILLLSGTGPEPIWDPKIQFNPIRGLRDMKFISAPLEKYIAASDARGIRFAPYESPDSAAWYIRHLERDNSIHKIIGDSNYGQRVLLSTTKGAAKATAGITLGILVGTVIVIAGAAVIYAGVYGHSGEAVLSGFLIMGWGMNKGYEIGRDAVNKSIATAKKEMDVSDRYRYVRFLPDKAFVIYGSGHFPITVKSGSNKMTIEADAQNEIKTAIRYLPPR